MAPATAPGRAADGDALDAPAAIDTDPMEPADSRGLRVQRVLNLGQLSTLLIAPLLIVARRQGWITARPIWQTLAAVFGTQLAITVSAALILRPRSIAARGARAIITMGGIGLCIYLVGWGPALTVGYLLGAFELIRSDGSESAWSAAAAAIIATTVGEIAVDRGWIPTLLEPDRQHPLAIVAIALSLVGIASIALSVRQREQAEAELRRRELAFRSLIEQASDAIAVLRSNGEISYVSKSIERMVGSIRGKNPFALRHIHPEDRERATSHFLDIATTESGVGWVELRVRHDDGTWRWIEVGVSNRLRDPSVRGIVCNLRDITDRKEVEHRLAHLASHDTLTGLPNRRGFYAHLDRVVARWASSPPTDAHSMMLPPALLFLDLDRFKLVNDTLGHDVGDQLLVEVARRLQACVRPGDVVGRLGGDEFTVLLPGEPSTIASDLVSGATDEATIRATAIAERIIAAIREPMIIGDHDIHTSTSIGIAVGDRHTQTAGELMQQADTAMYIAKENGRGTYERYHGDRGPHLIRRLEMEHQLRRGLESGELVVHYQPEVDLRSQRVVAVEALVRWLHPIRGSLKPTDFFDVAVEAGLMASIDRLVLREASQWAFRWNHAPSRTSGHPTEPRVLVSVNLSAKYALSAELIPELEHIIAETNVDPATIRLELIEPPAQVTNHAVIARLRVLRRLGFRVAIDNFGGSYASINALRDLPIDTVKLDPAFVNLASLDAGGRALVEGFISMSHALGIPVIAEGVEHAALAQALREMGCDRATGWYWSPACAPGEIERLLAGPLGAPGGI